MRRFRFIALVFAALMLIGILPAGGRPAAAGEDTGWVIDSFRSDITIERDGSLLITESIRVDFNDLQRHGIFREIPVEYSWDEKQNRIYEFELLTLTDDEGVPWPVDESRNGANVQLKIGDPDRTVTGTQSYIITYTLGGVLNAFPDHDELFWNVTGADWPVPIEAAYATVSLKSGGLEQAACFEGPTGSDTQCTHLLNEESRAILYSSIGALPPGEQMTIVAGIRKGVVEEPAPILVDKPENWFEKNLKVRPVAIAIAVATFLVGLVAIAGAWWRHGRDRVYRTMYYLSRDPSEQTRPLFHRNEVVVEYSPPDDLRPAQLGLILDESADTKDVTATIIDLAVRGYLTIEEKEKTWLFGKTDWRLTKKKDSDGALLPFEARVLMGLFEGSASEVDLSDLKNEFYDDLAQAQSDLYADADRRGWFSRSPRVSQGLAFGAGVALIAAGVGLGWLLGNIGWVVVAVPVVILGALAMLLSRVMSQRTAAGSETLRRALGFRLFIETADKRRQEFNERANIFAEYLPYAIVFGSVEKWAKAFEGIDTQPSTQSWYTGISAFAPLAFSQSLQSFSTSVSSVITSTPGSSGGSGFSGGGAGGGGGGGGGGSW